MADHVLMISGSQRNYLHQSQWLVVVQRTEGIGIGEDSLQSLEALEVSGKRHRSECSHEHGVFARIMVGLAGYAPPLCFTADEIDQIVGRTRKVLDLTLEDPEIRAVLH
jgi:adenosylmethionine-8-amino-7-oxononanoate aminotransferase